MVKWRPTATPTLGVTAVLASLWLVAAGMAGLDSPAAAAVDPGRTGSIGEVWGTILLGVALAVAIATPPMRLLGVAAAILMAGEVGELHLHAAQAVATMLDSRDHLREIKCALMLTLAAFAAFAVAKARPECCSVQAGALLVIAGAAACVFDVAQLGVTAGTGIWLAAAEEWSELAVYSGLAGCSLSSMLGKSAVPFRYQFEADVGPFPRRPNGRCRNANPPPISVLNWD